MIKICLISLLIALAAQLSLTHMQSDVFSGKPSPSTMSLKISLFSMKFWLTSSMEKQISQPAMKMREAIQLEMTAVSPSAEIGSVLLSTALPMWNTILKTASRVVSNSRPMEMEISSSLIKMERRPSGWRSLTSNDVIYQE